MADNRIYYIGLKYRNQIPTMTVIKESQNTEKRKNRIHIFRNNEKSQRINLQYWVKRLKGAQAFKTLKKSISLFLMIYFDYSIISKYSAKIRIKIFAILTEL